MAIEELENLKTLPLEELIGSLLTHEMKLKRLIEQEDNDRRKKGTTLKVADSEDDEAPSKD